MKELEKTIKQHLEERGWGNLRPADVAKSIMIEGAELLELFQWENLPLAEIKNNPEKTKEISKELADVITYAIEMSVLLGLDTEKIVREKLERVAKKYPAELMRKSIGEPGSATDVEYWRIKKEHRQAGN
jgi:NTP pyrophosphatase (non-canonical NTP hydrolase)